MSQKPVIFTDEHSKDRQHWPFQSE